uniref:Uncharacterized protein n=1 Tax=Nothobranchius pienaari TaxID=704102 RepID=A0A1A8KZZ5_9TELE
MCIDLKTTKLCFSTLYTHRRWSRFSTGMEQWDCGADNTEHRDGEAGRGGASPNAEEPVQTLANSAPTQSCGSKPSPHNAAQKLRPTRKYQKLQFHPHPLGAGVRSEQILIDSHVKNTNFTAEINMFTAWYQNMFLV